MSWTLTTSAAIWAKAGANVSIASGYEQTSGARLLKFSDEAEAWVNAETLQDWTTNYASVGTNFQQVLSDVVSSKAAIGMITFDMSGYTSRTEAQTMLDVNNDIVRKGIAFLKDKSNVQAKMGV
jgi:hypothetical protein